MLHEHILQLLIPLELGGTHPADRAVEGGTLDAAAASAARLLAEIYADSCDDFLLLWERYVGTIPASDATRGERIAEILYRLRALGRLDRQYFVDIAAAIGYDITIVELQPLMANWAQVGDEVQEEYVRWIWQVTISGGFTQYACASIAAVGEPIEWYRDDRHLKEIFEDLKPAHTQVVFV